MRWRASQYLAAARRLIRGIRRSRLREEKAQLEQELAKARFVVDVQAKLQALLETISEGADTGLGPSS